MQTGAETSSKEKNVGWLNFFGSLEKKTGELIFLTLAFSMLPSLAGVPGLLPTSLWFLELKILSSKLNLEKICEARADLLWRNAKSVMWRNILRSTEYLLETWCELSERNSCGCWSVTWRHSDFGSCLSCPCSSYNSTSSLSWKGEVSLWRTVGWWATNLVSLMRRSPISLLACTPPAAAGVLQAGEVSSPPCAFSSQPLPAFLPASLSSTGPAAVRCSSGKNIFNSCSSGSSS